MPWKRLVAEAVVIVAGVLIALAADRWAQGLDEREQGREYLGQLLEEFVQADSLLQLASEAAQRRQAQAELVVSAVDGTLPDSIDAQELVLALGLTHWLWYPELPRNTWQDLIGTGRLGLIQPQALRRAIAEFYRLEDTQAGFHAEWLEYVVPYRHRANSLFSPELQLAVAQFRLEQTPLPEELIPPRATLLGTVGGDPGLQATVGEVLMLNWSAVRQFRIMSERTQTVLEQLRHELPGR